MPRLIYHAEVAVRNVSDLMTEDEVQPSQSEMFRERTSNPASWPAGRESSQVFLSWDEVGVASIGFQAGVAYPGQYVRVAKHSGEDCGYQGDGSEMDTDEVDVLFTYTGETADFCGIYDPEFQRPARFVVVTLHCQPHEVCKVSHSVFEQVLVELVGDGGFVVQATPSLDRGGNIAGTSSRVLIRSVILCRFLQLMPCRGFAGHEYPSQAGCRP